MDGIRMTALGGETITLDGDVLATLEAALDGELARPGTAGYDEARTLWNAMIDRHPGVAVRCASEADIVRAVDFAREHDLLLSVRAGGHNIAGSAVADGSLLIDLSGMRDVDVDPTARRARVQPGATLGDVDAATQAHGLATPVGINSTTGISGLTLGGGFGWLSRRYGWTVDNLVSARVIMADGSVRVASTDDDADLFWAIRGGGGNFGVVSSFEFQLHPVGPEITAGLIVYPFADAPSVMRRYRETVASASDDLAAWCVLRKAPPLPFLPEDVHGTEVVVVAVFWGGPAGDAEAALAPLHALGTPIAAHVGPTPYAGWQTAFDPLLTPGARNYWKSHDFTELSDATIDLLLDAVGRLPSDECEVFVGHLGGAAGRVAADATAMGHRNAEFVMNMHTRWRDAADDDRCIAWARGLHSALVPHATGEVYVNFQPEDEMGRAREAWGSNLDRLVDLKRRYDPENRFRVNQNLGAATRA